MQAPDLLEPLIGFRWWHREASERLISPLRLCEWIPGTNEAKCRPAAHEQVTSHSAPHPDCHCGIYAYHCFSDLQTELDYHFPHAIPGVIALWGIVQAYAGGLRGQYAQLLAVGKAQDQSSMQAITDYYQVPLLDHSELAKTEVPTQWQIYASSNSAP